MAAWNATTVPDQPLSPFVTIRWVRHDGWRVAEVVGDIAALTGYAPEEFLSASVDYASVIHEADSPAVFERVGLATTGGARRLSLAYRIVTRDGRERRVWDETRIQRGPDGAAVGFVSFLAAIDDMPNPHQAEMFIAHASHEIRTPLTGVIGLVEALLTTQLTPSQRDLVEALREASGDLMQLANNMLDLAKLEVGAMELDVSDFRVSALVGGAERLFARRAADKGVALSSRGCGFDPIVRGDSLRLRQIVFNLVGNAVKFTERGHVLIDWSCGAPDADGQVAVAIAVRDTGPGMDPATLGLVFDSFRQGQQQATSRHSGTGLGLSIARSLTAMMGGRLWAESVPGKGSVFHFEAGFPIADTSQADLAVLGREESNAAARERIAALRPRILVVEDAPTIQRVLDLLLTPLGATVVIARDGVQAVAAFKDGTFDLVAMDSRLPVLGGVEATQELRAIEAREGRPRTPLLALTADTQPRTVEAFLAAGADGFLPKPFDPQRLVRTIAAMLPGGAETAD